MDAEYSLMKLVSDLLALAVGLSLSIYFVWKQVLSKEKDPHERLWIFAIGAVSFVVWFFAQIPLGSYFDLSYDKLPQESDSILILFSSLLTVCVSYVLDCLFFLGTAIFLLLTSHMIWGEHKVSESLLKMWYLIHFGKTKL